MSDIPRLPIENANPSHAFYTADLGQGVASADRRLHVSNEAFDSSKCEVQRCPLPDVPYNSGKYAVIVDNVFTAEECQYLIDFTEDCGYEAALVNIGGGRQRYLPDVRKGDRVILDDEGFADILFERVKEWVPPEIKNCAAVRCNERMRFLRYDPGGYFRPHEDGIYQQMTGPNKGQRSHVTVHLYLNEGMRGGSTRFVEDQWGDDPSRGTDCDCKIGRVLIFQHDICHCGAELEEGRKYTLRTDVMYEKKA